MFKKTIRDKRVIIGTFLTLVAVIIALFTNLINDKSVKNASNSDSERIKNEYEILNEVITEDGKIYPKVELSSNSIFKYSNITEVLNILENEKDAVIYFGKSTCLYCRSAIQILSDTALNTELDVIYYLDIKNTDTGYDKLLKVLEEKGIIDEEDKEYIPLVVFVVDGNIVSYNKGTISSQMDPYDELDKYQIESLNEIYHSGISDVLESINLKKGI